MEEENNEAIEQVEREIEETIKQSRKEDFEIEIVEEEPPAEEEPPLKKNLSMERKSSAGSRSS